MRWKKRLMTLLISRDRVDYPNPTGGIESKARGSKESSGVKASLFVPLRAISREFQFE